MGEQSGRSSVLELALNVSQEIESSQVWKFLLGSIVERAKHFPDNKSSVDSGDSLGRKGVSDTMLVMEKRERKNRNLSYKERRALGPPCNVDAMISPPNVFHCCFYIRIGNLKCEDRV